MDEEMEARPRHGRLVDEPMNNREYQAYKIQPYLGCSICPPNKGENSHFDYKSWKRRPAKRKLTKERRAERADKEAKKNEE